MSELNAVVELRVGGYSPPGTVFTHALERFKQLVERCSCGRMLVKLIPNVLELGIDTGQLLQRVEAGLLDGCYMSTAVPRLAQLAPELALFDVPFVVSSRERAFAALDGALGRRISTQIEAASNLKQLGYWENGFRHISSARGPIRSPADLAGLRLRIQANVWHERSFRLLGAEPVAMDVAELIPALIAGRVDGQENPHENTHSLGILRHTPYLTLTGHLFGIRGLYLNRERFEKLPAGLRSLLLAIGLEVAVEQRRQAAGRDADLLGIMAATGAQVTELRDPELAPFRDLVRPLHTELADSLGADLVAALSEG